MTVPDGMPVAWAARLLGWPIEKNIRGTTLMLRLCELAKQQNYSIFVYGSEQETLWELITQLLERFPGLRIAGYHSPPFRKLEPDEESRIINIINSRSVDILFVGLGAPKQEKWMASLCPRLSVPVTVGVGAAFDFLSGTKPEAPLWVQSHGLEWLFRLICEPKRLIGRYAVFNSKFAYWLAKQFLVTNSGKVARKIYSSRQDL
jgi:N-acetylglucosaminyldiphosphoundecaprenol N-acetyl-beta-D-mannosaminyltransferase